MSFSTWIKRLTKKKIISEEPHPIIPFLTAFLSVLLGFWLQFNLFFYLAGFTFIFAIMHLIVVINIKK